MKNGEITFPARILRKQEDLPRYVVVNAEHVPGRKAAFTAHVVLNECAPFERKIHPWGKGSDVFFFNLTAAQCAKANLDTNDQCVVTIIPKD